MAKWHYQKNGVTHGPVDSAGFKQLAQTGGLWPDDLLRRDDMQSWAKASKVNGLFPEQVSESLKESEAPVVVGSEQPRASKAEDQTPPKAKLNRISDWYYWPFTLLAMVLFFPWGLYLVWTNPTWTNRTKGIWTGGFALLIVFIAASIAADKKAIAEAIVVAHQKWDAGHKAEAVSTYRPLIEKLSLVAEHERPIVMQRLFDFDLTNGANDLARKTFDRSKKEGIVLSFTSPEAKKLLADIQTEEAKAKQEAIARSAESVEPIFLDDRVGSSTKDERARFIDDTASYKGKTIKMKMLFTEYLPNLSSFQQEVLGVKIVRAASFKIYWLQPKSNFDINIDLPESLSVPNFKYNDKFMVTFSCMNGSLESGNVALAVERE